MSKKEEIIEVTNETEIEVTSVMVSSLIHIIRGKFHVLLAERLKMPRYKSCSGQLIKKSLDLVQN